MTITEHDCYWVCASGSEAAMVQAYNDNDLLELGRLAKARLEESAANRLRQREEDKARYRAEILAEACQGGEA